VTRIRIDIVVPVIEYLSVRSAYPICVLLLLASASAVLAVPPKDPLVREWSARMAKTATLLEAKDYATALRLADQSISEMVEHLGPGDGATKWFGVMLVHKALALTGLGNTNDALWYWHEVLSMYPKFSESDLSSFGEAGAFLKANITPPTAVPFTHDPAQSFTPPRPIRRVKPEFPRGAADFSIEGTLIVEVVLGKDGHAKSPRIVQALEAPTLSYAALEAVKRWEFEPAKVAGVPVEVLYDATIIYKVP